MQSVKLIKFRAKFFEQIRSFFSQRDCFEVDTSLLRNWTVTDPYMRACSVHNPDGVFLGFLQTSPEYAMKKLLAATKLDIYQLGKVFRADEQGDKHRSEFCLLEWYRTGWTHWQLMDECAELLKVLLGQKKTRYLSWQEASVLALDCDLTRLSLAELRQFATTRLGELPDDLLKDDYLTFLFDQLIEPCLPKDELIFVYGFPASQASLAKIGILPENENKVSTRALQLAKGTPLAERFEIYSGGLELANGFHELTDVREQRARFEADNKLRLQMGLAAQTIDPELMAALDNGLPSCAGVAMGVDRLLMLATGANSIDEVCY